MEFGEVEIPIDAVVNIEDKFKNTRRKRNE
jgi:hypothetical protein